MFMLSTAVSYMAKRTQRHFAGITFEIVNCDARDNETRTFRFVRTVRFDWWRNINFTDFVAAWMKNNNKNLENMFGKEI